MTVQSFFYFLGIGAGLAMDAAALTIANCSVYSSSLSKKKAWSMPVAFAIFQTLMPIIGFYLGSLFAQYLSPVAGYITAGVFLILSLKILFDIIKDYKKEKQIKIGEKEDKKEKEKRADFSFLVLILQALATSIDALLIGFTFACDGIASPFIPCLIIGATTFIIVSVALLIGKSLGNLLGKYAIFAGAIILFALFVYNLVKAVIGA